MTSLEGLQPDLSDPIRDHLLRDTTEDAQPATVASVATTRERKLPGRRTLVELDGLEPFEVRIDNRDYLRWDRTAPKRKWGSGRDVPFLMATFLSWSAATRAGLTDLRWEDFEERAVSVEEVRDEDGDDDARPTR